jgi:HemY protein
MWAPEARLALARTAIEAREFDRARNALQPLLDERPTMRTALLMADLEQAEHGTTGRVREWLARAAHGRRDAAWVADGLVSDRWAPMSPVTGRLDAFQWQVPPDVLTGPAPGVLDDVVADLDEPVEPAPLLVSPPPEPAPAPQPMAATAEEITPVEDATDKHAVVIESEPVTDAPRPVEAIEPGDAAPVPEPAAKPNGSGAAHVEPAPVVFPVPHAPDDPGPDDADGKRSRFRLLG